jgi:large subunit ribosomal protein L14
MVQARSIINSADNTGAKKLRVIKVLGGYKKRYSRLGEIVTASVLEAVPHSMVKKGDVVHAVLVRTRKEVRRADGSYIRFDDNAGVIIDMKNKDMKGTRIFGPVARELRSQGYQKIISLAPEVL